MGDFVERNAVMNSIIAEYNRKGDRDGLKLAWIEKAVNEVPPALEQEPCDAVSREAAVNACLNGWNKDYKEIVADIRALPSVHPECIEDYCPAAFKPVVCKDYISRQTVLEVIRKCNCEGWVKAEIGAPIEALSPVTPAEKVGQWIEHYDGIGEWWECSQCGAHGGEGMKYCMFCGAKMQEVES